MNRKRIEALEQRHAPYLPVLEIVYDPRNGRSIEELEQEALREHPGKSADDFRWLVIQIVSPGDPT